ncbi:hypothetical protein [Arthrobacter globiformis]|uniref:hypothetical protein n=1 Tax=Arthrobacter globiformis TaxID=1665 RepID=UPI002787513C|nr:hypothetical protein [Arthrobacter globiformis]MDQ0864483.1 hypothetical protein [Arthrobacter globiformis]
MTAFVMILIAVAQIAPATAAGLTQMAETTPPAEPAGIGIRLLDIPASSQNDPRARTYIIDRLAPGGEIKRRIQVENNTAEAQTVHVYSGAAHIEAGSFVGENTGSINELSTWTKAAQPQIELPAGGSADVLVTIKVPTDAPEGEQYGAVWAEVRSAADKGGVVQANRVGIRVYLSVGPGNGKPANFSVTSLTPGRDQNGNPQLSALVTNTGGRALDITGTLRLAAGPGGLSAGPFGIQKAATIAPGKAQNVTFTLPAELPNGPWTASVSLKSGLLERKATATLTFPDAGPGEAVTPVQEEETPWSALMALAAAALITLIATALLMQRRRRRRRAAMPRENDVPGTRRANRQRTGATR